MKKEIIFFYNNQRCHALIVQGLLGGEKYIGKMDGFEIYQIPYNGWFDQFGFVAIKEEGRA